MKIEYYSFEILKETLIKIRGDINLKQVSNGYIGHCIEPSNHKNGDKNASFSIFQNAEGHWRYKCHSCQISGNVFDLYQKYLGGGEIKDIAKTLAKEYNISDNQHLSTIDHTQTKDEAPLPIISTIPREIFNDIKNLKYYSANKEKYYPCSSISSFYPYYDVNREIIFIRCRTESKSFFYLKYNKEESRLETGAPTLEKKPLYNLPAILNDLDKHIIFVEGEKDVENGTKHFGAEYIFTTAGGVGDIFKFDTTPLKNRCVYILFDNDKQGVLASLELNDRLKNVCRKVKAVAPYSENERYIHDKNLGYDLSDAIEHNYFTPEYLKKYLLEQDINSIVNKDKPIGSGFHKDIIHYVDIYNEYQNKKLEEKHKLATLCRDIVRETNGKHHIKLSIVAEMFYKNKIDLFNLSQKETAIIRNELTYTNNDFLYLYEEYQLTKNAEISRLTLDKLNTGLQESNKLTQQLLNSTKNNDGNFNISIEEELLKKIEETNNAISEYKSAGVVDSIFPPLSQDKTFEIIKNIDPGFESSFIIGDEPITFERGTVSFVGSPPKHGKTTFLISLYLDILKRYKDKTHYFFSYEESREAIILKMMLNELNVHFSNNNYKTIKSYIKSGQISTEFFSQEFKETHPNYLFSQKFRHFFETISNAKITYENLNIEQLISTIRELSRRQGTGLIVIDYLQLINIESTKYVNPFEKIKVICNEIKDVAVKNNTAILIATQFNRETKTPEDLIPQNLSEGSDIEKSANTIWGVFNFNQPAYYGNLAEHRKHYLYQPEYKEVRKNKMLIKRLLGRDGISDEEIIVETDFNCRKIFTQPIEQPQPTIKENKNNDDDEQDDFMKDAIT